ncbi:glycosyltransferase [Limnofasciculus baicalensis]|uniref:Glycosyltransferase n=1 Tax=Limnofasciculus baicalensis BBK-W-15 TaxID=2699891 RepID=A0AAE3GRQ4_9CYAN|nr:glycosyltransferase [Limnofasciculus baicalensis]MCP2728628.1 glycosyltransferase [Limnofasciculus baicalensis BBK-W-15]
MRPEKNRKLLIFDLFYTGHHAGYILHLVRYWQEQNLPGKLDILVTPKFIKSHPDVVNAASERDRSNINFVAISPEEEAKLKSEDSSRDRLIRAFQEWHLLNKYVKQLEVTQCLLMYFDSILLSLALLRRFPCPLSGIYFRPIFHYSEFAEFAPSRHEGILQKRDKFVLSLLLGNSHLKNLFCLDTFAVDYIKKLNPRSNPIYLPDPVQIYSESDSKLAEIRNNLAVQPGRTTFLMFGVPQRRKGIYELLDAIAILPSEICQKFCLFLVGPIASEPLVKERLAQLSETLPIQVIIRDEFVPDREIQSYFQVSDVILAPYQRHIGMSAILVRAAAADKPVLSTNYGLMGEIVKRDKLGLTVDASVPAEIAKGLTEFILKTPSELCDISSMKDFAEQNSAERFASTIFQYI